eukprot:g31556.t1
MMQGYRGTNKGASQLCILYSAQQYEKYTIWLWLYLLHKMMNSSLECSICFERFDDEKLCPRLLCCGHSFCSGCWRSFSNMTPSLARPAERMHLYQREFMACPRTLPFWMSLPLQRERKMMQCKFATLSMCKEAARFHTRNKDSQTHRVISLEELKASPQLAAIPIFCSEHNELFRYSTRIVHNGHKCSSLAEAASKCREEMKALSAKATAHAAEIKAAEARVVGVHQNLERKHEQEAAKIRATFKERIEFAERNQKLYDFRKCYFRHKIWRGTLADGVASPERRWHLKQQMPNFELQSQEAVMKQANHGRKSNNK